MSAQGTVPPYLFEQEGTFDVPYTFTVPGSIEVQPYTAHATFDGSGASGTFRPCLTFYSASGAVLGRYFPADTVAAGESAEVTYTPPFGTAATSPSTGGGIQFDTLNVGDWLSVETTDGLATKGQTFITHGGGFNITDHAGGGFNVQETGGGGFNVQETDGGISFKELGDGGVLIEDQGDDGTLIRDKGASGMTVQATGAGAGLELDATGASTGSSSRLTMERGTLPDGITGAELRVRQDAAASPTGEILVHTQTNAGVDVAALRLGPAVNGFARLSSFGATHAAELNLLGTSSTLNVTPGDTFQFGASTGGGTANDGTVYRFKANIDLDVYTSEPAAPGANLLRLYGYHDGGGDHLKVIFSNGTKVTLATS